MLKTIGISQAEFKYYMIVSPCLNHHFVDVVFFFQVKRYKMEQAIHSMKSLVIKLPLS